MCTIRKTKTLFTNFIGLIGGDAHHNDDSGYNHDDSGYDYPRPSHGLSH